MRVVLPPAAPIFSAADAEKAWAWTSTLTPPSSPVPRTLTGWLRRTAPASASVSGFDRSALREQRRDPVEVDDLEDDLVRALEAGELGQPHVQRGLPTLEAGVRVATRAGALGAATGRLALGALTAADARLGGVGARGRTQVVDLQCHGDVLSSDFFDGDQVRHRRDHPADLGTVLLHDRVVDPLEAQRTQRLALVRLACRSPDLTWVTLSCAISDSLARTGTEHGGRGDVLERQTAAGRDLLGADEVLQRLHRGVHDVDRVRGTRGSSRARRGCRRTRARHAPGHRR